MNPTVKVAYERNWYSWHTTVLRVGLIRWWVGESPFLGDGSEAHRPYGTLESRGPVLVRRLDLGSGGKEEGLLYVVKIQPA